MKRWILIQAVLGLSLLACSTVQSLFAPNAVSDETPSAPTFSPTADQAIPTANLPSPTHAPVHCPLIASEPALPDAPTFDGLQDSLLQSLNSGVSLQALTQWLREQNLANEAGLPLEADFNGDGYFDIVLSVQDPEAETVLPPGMLLLYLCAQNQFALNLHTAPQEGMGAPGILAAQDLSHDSIADLLTAEQSCGAHTCFTTLKAYVCVANQCQDRLQGNSDDLPNAAIEIQPTTQTISATGTGVGSVGAGPYQPRTRQWTWDGTQIRFVVTQEQLLPSAYRIHVLHDADRAAGQGDYPRALELYTRVIAENELQAWIDPTMERVHLSLFATYRQMQIGLAMDGHQLATERHATLIGVDLESDLPGIAYRLLADEYWRAYQEGGAQAACAAAIEYAQSNQDTILTPLYFGYANPTYEPEDMCLPMPTETP